MKARILVVITVAGIILNLFSQIKPDTAGIETQEVVPTPVDPAMEQAILNATVHIDMVDILAGSETTASGLATLVNQDGEVIVVTHDHWPLLDNEHGRVHFRNTESQLLANISLAQFRNLVRHQDKGTMILDLPPQILVEFVTPVSVSSVPHPTNGDSILVVHQATTADTSENNPISLVVSQATVREVTSKGGLPVFILENVKGNTIIPGDSGGGVWFQGLLVGNMWSTVMEVTNSAVDSDVVSAQPRPTATSIAAQLTLNS